MGKYKYLFKNVGLLAIGQFSTRLLTFFLVPLYTSILSTYDYGTFDLYSTIVQLLVPVLTLNIYDGILRFALDKTEDVKQVYAVGFTVFLFGSVFLFALIVLNREINFLPIVNQYPWLFFAYYIVNALSFIFNNYARGVDDVSATVISGIISTLTMIVLNIWFLVGLKWGLFGYFLANIIGIGAGCLLYVFKLRLWSISPISSNYILTKNMVKYSAPLVVNSTSWWLNSASSRYIIIAISGIGSNGLFSAASKVPSIISMAANLFNSAWVMSSVKEFDPNDKDRFFSNTFKIFSAAMMICSSILISGSLIIGTFLFRGDFSSAWLLTPFLIVGAAFSAIAGYLGGLFAAAKKTKIFAYSTAIGCIVNIVFGILFTYYFDVIGTAAAVLVSNYIILLIRFIQIKGFMRIDLSLRREHLVYIILILQSFNMIVLSNHILMYLIDVLILFFILFLYRREIQRSLRKVFFKQRIGRHARS
ncbi:MULTISPECIES: oligosaccharide flippase family protein [unclassified Bifidobacterium]|uniref:oligosaccharide flippase family protein n=1 Tax=unclassified Bifidobacterium TaxID=2608897 RepID=UPI001126018A|nr:MULTISPECIES: oligosaccharide flippase family protein [unclassified Bifidobacterium]